MKFHKYFLTVFLFLLVLSSFSVYAKEKTILDGENLTIETPIISNISDTLEILDFKEDFKFKHSLESEQLYYKEIKKKSKDDYDLILESENSKVKLKSVKNKDDVESVSIHKNLKITNADIIEIKNIELESAEVTLALNRNESQNLSIVTSILHSDDGINFYRTNTPFIQNETHVIFNVSSFSSWTAGINDIDLFIDYPYSPYYDTYSLYLDSYANPDFLDYYAIQFPVNGFYEELDNKGGEGDYSTATNSDNMDMYDVWIDAIDLVYLEVSNVGIPLNNDDKFFTFIIRNYDDTLDRFQTVELNINEFEYADADYPYAPTEYEDVPYARFYGKCDFNDEAGHGTITGGFQVRVQGSGTWDTSSLVAVSNNVFFGYDSATLDYNTVYEYRTVCDTPLNTYFSSTATFSISPPVTPEPTVSTVPALIGSEYGILRASVDFDGYEDLLYLAFNYSCDGGSSWTTTPTIGDWLTPYDGVINSEIVTGLTNGVECSYFGFIATSEDMDDVIDIGETLTFTPFNDSESGTINAYNLYENLTFYSSYDTDFTDLTENEHTVTNTNVVITSGGEGVINEGADFELSSSSYLSVNDADDLSFTDGSGNDIPFSTCGFIEPESSSVDMCFLSKYDGAGVKEYNIFYSGNTFGDTIGITLYKSDASAYLYKYSSTGCSIGEKCFYCFTYDGSENIYGIKVYFNGVLETGGESATSGTYTGMTNSNNKMLIGARYSSSPATQLYFDGIIDEMGIWKNRVLNSSEISILYNAGNGLSYSDFEFEFQNYAVDTIEPLNISYNSVVFRGISYNYEEPLTNFTGGFRWKFTGEENWIQNISSPDTLENNTIFSFNTITSDPYISLNPETNYTYQAFIIDFQTSEIYLGEEVNFTTLEQPIPVIETLSALNVTNDSAILRMEIPSLNDWNSSEFFFELISSEGEYILIAINNEAILNEGDTYSFDLSNWLNYDDITYFICSVLDVCELFNNSAQRVLYLDSETSYLYRGGFYYDDDLNQTGNWVIFDTSETGAPVINTEEPSTIRRTTAYFNGEIVDLGIYNDGYYYFRYENVSGNYTTIPELIEYETTLNIFIDDLSINTTYDVELILLYDDSSRNVSGGIITFKTLGLEDFIAPTITNYPIINEITYNTALLGCYVNLEDANESTYYFSLRDSSDHIINDSAYLEVTTNGSISYLFENLEDETSYYYYCGLIYEYNETLYPLITSNYVFYTLSVADSPKQFKILGGLIDIYVEDPVKFRFIGLFFIPIISFCFAVSLLKSNGEIFFPVFMAIGLSIELGAIIVLYFYDLLNTQFIILSLISLPLILYFNMRNQQ